MPARGHVIHTSTTPNPPRIFAHLNGSATFPKGRNRPIRPFDRSRFDWETVSNLIVMRSPVTMRTGRNAARLRITSMNRLVSLCQ
ncbi:hypothetical protein RHSP_55579 [Rhizobium freirei PRF 81]|uniref:Uncharacterized protein n=1 Tax=Rhizobium freirei PRF 81 TaxID=363754 RepID=N6UWS1_9HYPH|nr:hypothetical protein RHSP_55579 [Rhizobium freirei PRF 81]